jgi:hypothetical protein
LWSCARISATRDSLAGTSSRTTLTEAGKALLEARRRDLEAAEMKQGEILIRLGFNDVTEVDIAS